MNSEMQKRLSQDRQVFTLVGGWVAEVGCWAEILVFHLKFWSEYWSEILVFHLTSDTNQQMASTGFVSQICNIMSYCVTSVILLFVHLGRGPKNAVRLDLLRGGTN